LIPGLFPPAAADGDLVRSGGFVVGLDLGQARDFSAVVANDAHHGRGGDVHHSITFLHRFPLGTSYPDVVDGVASLMRQLPARRRTPALVCDATGVGRPVLDLVRARGLFPIGVSITAGDAVTRSAADDWRIAKRVLVSGLQVALQTGRLQVAAALPLTQVLVRELSSFSAKISASGSASFEAWREADHDDLVLALAIAVWHAEERAKGYDLMQLVGH
jgi:hypothetical protein